MKLAGRYHQPLQIHRAGQNKFNGFTGKLASFPVDIPDLQLFLSRVCCGVAVREISGIEIFLFCVVNSDFRLQQIVIRKTQGRNRAFDVRNRQ